VLGAWLAGALWHLDGGRSAFLAAGGVAALAAVLCAYSLRGSPHVPAEPAQMLHLQD
jgi:PPP family 3-phenylpropionic acid transporter